MAHESALALKRKAAQSKWLSFISDVMEENAAREPIVCRCGEGFVTTIFGCDLCAEEEGIRQGAELEDPNFTWNHSRWSKEDASRIS